MLAENILLADEVLNSKGSYIRNMYNEKISSPGAEVAPSGMHRCCSRRVGDGKELFAAANPGMSTPEKQTVISAIRARYPRGNCLETSCPFGKERGSPGAPCAQVESSRFHKRTGSSDENRRHGIALQANLLPCPSSKRT